MAGTTTTMLKNIRARQIRFLGHTLRKEEMEKLRADAADARAEAEKARRSQRFLDSEKLREDVE